MRDGRTRRARAHGWRASRGSTAGAAAAADTVAQWSSPACHGVIAAVAVAVGVDFFGVALLVGTAGVGRVPVRGRCDGRGGPGGAAADRHPVAGDRVRSAWPQTPRARPPSGGGRDTRVDDVHLHRQDRHPHPQRDGGRRGLDAARRRPRSRASATSRSPTVRCDAADVRGASSERRASSPRGARSGHVVEDDGRWVPHGDPMEAALDAFARRLGVDIASDAATHPRRAASRSTRAVVGCRSSAGDTGARQRGAGRGAAAVQCRSAAAPRRSSAWPAAGSGCSRSPAATLDARAPPGGRRRAPRQELKLLGLVGARGPAAPRRGGAIAACRRAGIRVAMVTGDHPATAARSPARSGLLGAGKPSSWGTTSRRRRRCSARSSTTTAS